MKSATMAAARRLALTIVTVAGLVTARAAPNPSLVFSTPLTGGQPVLMATDAQLLGRKTYEGFAKAWPTMEGTGDFGVRMNTMPKYVVTSTLDQLEWPGSKPIKGDFV